MPTLELNGLNDAQRQAVLWETGPLLLLAGPGSGKTFTITKRILYLLCQGIPPEEILVITFTKDAALAMRSRFTQMSDLTYPVNFGTFHSVFYHILQESGGFRSRKLLDAPSRKNLMISILRRHAQSADYSEYPEEAAKVLAALGMYKNTGDRERAVSEMPTEWSGCFDEILAAYTEALRKNKALDFDDMLFECLRLLRENERARQSWQRRFSHILIDEFQDCNPIQYEVVKLLSAPPHNLFAVGDDDQSIYGFRGAEPDVLRRFAEEFRAKRLLLDVNYRCTEEIVRASLAVIGENRNRFPKELRAASLSESPGLHIRTFRDREEQSGWMVEEARLWREAHAGGGAKCAVLFRTNAQMQRAAAALHGAGIPFFKREAGKSVYEHFVAKDIMAYLLLAAGEWKREYLLRIVNRPVRYISREAVGEGRTIRELQEYYREQIAADSRRAAGPAAYRSGGNAKSEAGGYRWEILRRLSCLERQLAGISRMTPALGVQYVLKAVDYGGFLRTLAKGSPEKLAEWMEVAEWMKGDAGRFRSVRDWAQAQEICIAETGKAPGQTGEGEALWLMTVHGSKGLEFDKVIIPDCNEKIFPNGDLIGIERVEEERRIFYVAMTRAKKSLELLCLTSDKGSSRLPSRFLNPLSAYSSASASSSSASVPSSSTSSSNSQLSRYSSKASSTFSYSASSSM